MTGERGHYEIAAGHDARPLLHAIEKFAQGIGLIPKQIWDGPDSPLQHLHFGGATNAAMPLLWAHSEYVKLQRSAADGKVFDQIDAVYDRYVTGHGKRRHVEVWKFNRQVTKLNPGTLLRIQASFPFLLHWSNDEWQHSMDIVSSPTGIGIEFVDIAVPQQNAPIRFTFLWLNENRWEGQDYKVEIAHEEVKATGA